MLIATQSRKTTNEKTFKRQTKSIEKIEQPWTRQEHYKKCRIQFYNYTEVFNDY